MAKLIIFADYGSDDACATASVLNEHERFERIDIVAIGGNVPVDIAFQNCYTLLSEIPYANSKITVVDTRHIEQPGEYLADIHGKDGMGDIFERRNDTKGITEVKYEDWILSLKGDETILSLGPMTMVKPVLERYGAMPLIIMGGCVDTPPNFNGYEFNQALDREAFSYCVRFPHAAITLDTCRLEVLDIFKYEIEGDDKYSQLLRASRRMSRALKESSCHVWDDVAACYLLHPERFVTEEKIDKDGNVISNAKYISPLPYCK